MSWKRSPFTCRLKTRVAIFGFSLVLISMSLLYRALMSHDKGYTDGDSSFPTMNRKRPLRFQSKRNIPGLELNMDKFDQSFRPVNKLGNKDESDLNFNFPRNIGNHFKMIKDRDLLSADSKEALTIFLKQLYPTEWAKAAETDEVALDLKYILLDYGFESKMSCKDIDKLRLGSTISFSRTKLIEYAYIDDEQNNGGMSDSYSDNFVYRSHQKSSHNSDIAVKSPSNDLDTKIACMKQVYDSDLCAAMGNYRMLREVLLMSTLRHPCILALKGYCLRGNRLATKLQEKGLVMVTEVGFPITNSMVQTATWYQRVSMAYQVSQLLLYLDSSPFGSLRLKKLDLKDFVLIKGQDLKLSDLDELELGERSCRDKSHCHIDNTDLGTECSAGMCTGLNSLINLNLASHSVLLVLLHNPHQGLGEKLVKSLETMSLTVPDLVSQLQIMNGQISHQAPVLVAKPERKGTYENRAIGVRAKSYGDPEEEDKPEKAKGRASVDRLIQFERQDMKNFAGVYDYPCSGSRVSWGCVHTVSSLQAAAELCLSDLSCRAFVTFTTRPESETLMTVVLKNGTDAYPLSSSGSTLFILKSAKYDVILRMGLNDGADNSAAGKADLGDNLAQGGGVESVAKGKSLTEVRDCVDRVVQMQESARYSREKRLMTHLGLKGMREQVWRRSALNQEVRQYSRIIRVEGGGGKFLVNFTQDTPRLKEQPAKKASFIVEDGPRAYHTSYALIYHLDRLLGLYHTPPCVGRELGAEQVDRFHRNPNWEETFRPLVQSDGTLTGILAVPTPKVMRLSHMTLTPRHSMISTVVPFDRPDKLQLEYVLLWWLGRMDKQSHDHLGYKGHLIHFYADKAFTNTSVNLNGYLNHCQFPSVVYKSLSCFLCVAENGAAIAFKVCSLGEEALRRAHSMFQDDVDFMIQGLKERTLIKTVDAAASEILRTVDKCIQKFGKENVLY